MACEEVTFESLDFARVWDVELDGGMHLASKWSGSLGMVEAEAETPIEVNPRRLSMSSVLKSVSLVSRERG